MLYKSEKEHMGSNILMDHNQTKHLRKSIMTRRDQQKQLFYGLCLQLKHANVFFQIAIRARGDHCCWSSLSFYITVVRDVTGVSLCLHGRLLFD